MASPAVEILFAPGRISYPPEAQRALRRADEQGIALLLRHLSGDWGDVDEKRRQVNQWAIVHRYPHNKPVISRYLLSGERQILITTRHLHLPGKRQTVLSLIKPVKAISPQQKSKTTQRSKTHAK